MSDDFKGGSVPLLMFIFSNSNRPVARRGIERGSENSNTKHVEGYRDGPTWELTQNALLTVVMTQEKQGWTIAAFQNTAVIPRQ